MKCIMFNFWEIIIGNDMLVNFAIVECRVYIISNIHIHVFLEAKVIDYAVH